MKNLKKTKIIATLGPSVTGKIFTFKDYEDQKNIKVIVESKQRLLDLFLHGVNVVRLNFSHGTYEEQTIRLRMVREVIAENRLNVSILLDTKGPEIRVGKIKGEELKITAGDNVKVYTTLEKEGFDGSFYVTDSSKTYNMAKDVKKGNIIYVDDGKLKLIVENVDVDNGVIEAVAENTHSIKENKRINLPNSDYSMPFLSEKDIKDINFAIENNFDYIAASFVNSAKNVNEIRKILEEKKATNIQIISKIETMSAVNNISSIIDASDGIMIARGDLGLETPYYDVPYHEKYIIKACRFKGKPVIVATQMLDSLESKLQATRAEVTDVFFAVERGTDATMLSGETASGLYPVNAVDVMTTINTSSEKLFDYNRSIQFYFKNTPFFRKKSGRLARKVACMTKPERHVENSEIKQCAVFYFDENVEEIRALSNIRVAAPIFVITSNPHLVNAFGINYGIHVIDPTLYNWKKDDSNKICESITKKYSIPNCKVVTIINGEVTER